MSTGEIRVFINGTENRCDKANAAFALGIETLIPHINHMSDENIKIWLKDLWIMLYDKEEGLGARMYGATKDFLTYLEKPYLKGDNLIKFVFELLLGKEGLSVGKEVHTNTWGDVVK